MNWKTVNVSLRGWAGFEAVSPSGVRYELRAPQRRNENWVVACFPDSEDRFFEVHVRDALDERDAKVYAEADASSRRLVA